MSVDAMTMVTVSGPENMVDMALGHLVVGRQFHPENAVKAMSEIKVLSPLDSANPFVEQLSRALDLMGKIDLEPDYRDFSEEELDERSASGHLKELNQKLASLTDAEKKKITQINSAYEEKLYRCDDFGAELSKLVSRRYLKFRFGRMPEDNRTEILKEIDSRPDVYYFDSGKDDEWYYGGYFALPGNYERVDSAIATLGFERIYIDVDGNLGSTKVLSPLDSSNPFVEQLSRALNLLAKVGIQPDYRDFSENELNVDDVAAFLNELDEKLSSLASEKAEKEKLIQNNRALAGRLHHYDDFDVELSDLFSMRYLKFRVGRMPKEARREIVKKMDARPDVYYFDSGSDEYWCYGGYFALLENYEKVDSVAATLGFEKIHMDVDGNIDSTVAEVAERLEKEAAAVAERLTEIDEAQKSIIRNSGEKLLVVYSWIRFMSECAKLRTYIGCRHGKFYLVGWVPTDLVKDYENECLSIPGFSCVLSANGGRDKKSPPVKFKKGFLSGIYEPFVNMYGLPSYGELDPRFFMAITYTLIFGIMFGDVGQGALLIALGLFLWKSKGLWLGRIVAICGTTATIMGFVYGSVFGYEHLLPGFKVLEDGNTMKMLMVAVAIGVFLILVCMILNIITGIRQKNIKKIFFDPNGISGFVLYAGIAFGAVYKATGRGNVFTTPYILGVVVLPLFLIFAATPLTKLLTGQKDWKPKSVAMFIVEGFFELFETLLSYVSNTVSFLRIGAFAISHAGMMMVVYLLSSGADGYSIGGLIFGNLFVAGLETVLVCIQVMRLEFYEMFGRFYHGGGEKFTPVEIDYKAAR